MHITSWINGQFGALEYTYLCGRRRPSEFNLSLLAFRKCLILFQFGTSSQLMAKSLFVVSSNSFMTSLDVDVVSLF